MSSDAVALSVRGLSKSYTILHQEKPEGAGGEEQTRETAPARPRGLKERLRLRRQSRETFWALQNVSFDIRQGDVVGILGRNGAGKSTLLKVLSRITEPTRGEVRLYGRVGSLLEVGTGFHPELTGRENVYLNGAILGMSRREIDRHFDAIVDFSGVERFLDTPVKRYSSGMYVRLAFAVAAHLDSEILILDEVLAVGDGAFQKKCLRKMEDAARDGRTVLFVSHNMNAMASLCSTGIYLKNGTVDSVGPIREQIGKYSNDALTLAGRDDAALDRDAVAYVEQVRLLNDKEREAEAFDVFEPICVELTVVQRRLEVPIRLVLRVKSANDGTVVLSTSDGLLDKMPPYLEAGERVVRCLVPANSLNTGTYTISVGIDEPRGPIHFMGNDLNRFTVVNGSPLGEGIYGDWDGIMSPYQVWEVASWQPSVKG